MDEHRDDIDLSIIVPVFNEESVLPEFIRVLEREMAEINLRYEVIFVDDGSSDESAVFLKRIIELKPHIRGISFARNFGKEAAIAAGLSEARGRLALTMDGDLQHPPSVIKQMLEAMKANSVDIVEGIREERGEESVFHGFSSRFYYWLFTKLTKLDLAHSSDFKLLTRNAIDLIVSMPERQRFYRAISYWTGLPSSRLTFRTEKRSTGQSKWSYVKLGKLFFLTIAYYSALPLLISFIIAGGMALFSGCLGIYTLVNFIRGTSPSGYATVVFTVLICSSFLMCGLGVIGLYIWLIYEEVKQRPLYIIKDNFGATRR